MRRAPLFLGILLSLAGAGRDRVLTLMLRGEHTVTARVQVATRTGPAEGWAKGDHGLYPTYHEKIRAGLDILDYSGQPLFSARFPERLYGKFEDAPGLLVKSLLFIENRELLERNVIQRALANNGYSRARAANALGISRVTLYKKMKKYGLMTSPLRSNPLE